MTDLPPLARAVPCRAAPTLAVIEAPFKRF
jgi:hypothetical protein